MVKQWPTLDITCSNQYHVRAQVDKVKSHFFHSASDIKAGLYDVHHIVSDADHLEFIVSLLAANKDHFPVMERVEGVVRSPNLTKRMLEGANE